MSDPRIGRRYGNYLIERVIGRGGMGMVYAAVQPDIGKLVAVKFLSREAGSSQLSVQRFFAEARAVNVIQHESIVDIFDFGHTPDGDSYYVMELLSGHTLEAELAEKTRLEIPRALEIARQVADAIAAAHERGIIHRDLKPDNLFLVDKRGRESRVKVLDFGVAKLAEPPVGVATLAGVVLGTAGYMSPEQATGSPIDVRSDIYALAVILFRMLSGRMPFLGRTNAEIVPQQLSNDAPSVLDFCPETPPAIADLLARCLKRDRQDRPSAMSELRRVLDEALTPTAHISTPKPARTPIFLIVAIVLAATGLTLAISARPADAPSTANASASANVAANAVDAGLPDLSPDKVDRPRRRILKHNDKMPALIPVYPEK